MSETIRFAWGDSSLGDFMIARSAHGLVACEFAGRRALVEDGLRKRFPDAVVVEDEIGLARERDEVRQAIETPGFDPLLPLDLRGSIYEISIWRMLRRIPPGTTASCSELAFKIGARDTYDLMAAIRANPIAVLVPCHRVTAEDESLFDYRWGICRRRILLQRERVFQQGHKASPADGKQLLIALRSQTRRGQLSVGRRESAAGNIAVSL